MQIHWCSRRATLLCINIVPCARAVCFASVFCICDDDAAGREWKKNTPLGWAREGITAISPFEVWIYKRPNKKTNVLSDAPTFCNLHTLKARIEGSQNIRKFGEWREEVALCRQSVCEGERVNYSQGKRRVSNFVWWCLISGLSSSKKHLFLLIYCC